MKRASLVASAAIVVVANALALAHAWRNRTGTPEAEITLTQRELRYFNSSAAGDDSGVTLYLEWTDPSSSLWLGKVEQPPTWLDEPKLQKLGFACSVSAASPDAASYYQRQRPRQVFVALEYEGAAWRAWEESYERALAERRAKGQLTDSTGNGLYRSHLIAVDADVDPAKLRTRYPDPTAIVVMPAVISVSLDRFPYPGIKLDPKRPPRVVGRIQQLPSAIHVPRPFSDQFLHLNQRSLGAWNKDMSYRVHLRYGASSEPWVTGVDFLNR